MNLIDIKALKAKFLRRSNQSIYDDMAKGVLTRSIHTGPKRIGWPEHEIETILSARAAGLDEPAIKELVTKLHTARQEAFQAHAEAFA